MNRAALRPAPCLAVEVEVLAVAQAQGDLQDLQGVVLVEAAERYSRFPSRRRWYSPTRSRWGSSGQAAFLL